jgi:hypothetical protein
MKFFGGFHSEAIVFFQLSVKFLLPYGLPLLGRVDFLLQIVFNIRGCVENFVEY